MSASGRSAFGAKPKPRSAQDLYGIAALAVATLLIVAPANWAYGYYQVLRIVTCSFSVVVLYRERQKYISELFTFALLGVILFNPVIKIDMAKDAWSLWDFAFAFVYAIYGINNLSARLKRVIATLLNMSLSALLALGFVSHSYMPHGPSFSTGYTTCPDDNRGPCDFEYVGEEEDMSHLNIPEWARFLREYGVFIFLILIFTRSVCGSDKAETDIVSV
jgi:hypothetical protein